MLFDISNYNELRLWLLFLVLAPLNLWVFKSRYHSFLDPFAYTTIWLATMLAFSIELFLSIPSIWSCLFCAEIAFAEFLLFKLFPRIEYVQTATPNAPKVKSRHICLLWIVFLAMFFIDFIWSWKYLIENGFFLAAQYKFVKIAEGRIPVLAITSIWLSTVFSYLTLYILFTDKKRLRRWTVISMFMHNIIILTLTGNRSAVLFFLISLGFGAFYFRHYIDRSIVKSINRWTVITVSASLIITSIVSGLILSKGNDDFATLLENGGKVVTNRVFANGDGLEYFVKFQGEDLISPFGFITYNLGPYLNVFLEQKLKNMGRLLVERALGSNVDAVQGPNFVFPLQSLMMGSVILAPLILFFVIYVAMRFRQLKAGDLSPMDIFYFGFASIALSVLVDSESFFFSSINWVIAYVFLYPVIWLFFGKQNLKGLPNLAIPSRREVAPRS